MGVRGMGASAWGSGSKRLCWNCYARGGFDDHGARPKVTHGHGNWGVGSVNGMWNRPGTKHAGAPRRAPHRLLRRNRNIRWHDVGVAPVDSE